MDSQNRDKEFYQIMLNAVSGLEDDLAANMAPAEAIDLMRRIIEICEKDYKERF